MMKLCKIIRIITVAPLAAALAVTLLFLHGGFFANGANFAAAIISLTVFPLLAYPVSLIKKGDERRRFQRSLAIVLAVAGYIGGLLFSLAANAADGERVLYLTYLLSGVAIAFSSFLLKKKSSGHACGIAGPVALLAYYVHPLYLLGLLLLLPVGYASLKAYFRRCYSDSLPYSLGGNMLTFIISRPKSLLPRIIPDYGFGESVLPNI